MSKAITFTRRLIAVIILIIIGVSLIMYFFFPFYSQKPPTPAYTYYVTIYDVIGNRTNIIAKNITVVLQGITNSSINITLSNPNYNNLTYQFDNLPIGDYVLKVLSRENITVFNKTLHIDRDIYDRIVIPSQPLTIQVLVNGTPSKFGYDLVLINIDKNLRFNASISTATGSYTFSQLPIGRYRIYLYYLGLPVNETSIDVNGSTNLVNLNTKLISVKFLLKDNKTGILNQTRLYLIYENKSIGPYISANNGTITVNNIPPLNFQAVFSYKGINVTTLENANINLSSTNQRFFNFTTVLANLTLRVVFDNGTPAKSIGVILSPNLITKLGEEGNVTILNIPANTKIPILLNKTSFIILRSNITLEAYSNNTISLTIPSYNLNYTLKGYSNLNNFKIYYSIQDFLNITTSKTISTINLNIKLYPSIYIIYIFVQTPSNNSILLYKDTIILNNTITKTVDVPLGYIINVNTNSPEDLITLYYIDQYGSHKIAEAKGSYATFSDLIPGYYKIVVERQNSFITSRFISISIDSPKEINLTINTMATVSLSQTIQESTIVFVVLLILIALLGYGTYRTYKSKKTRK